MHDARGRRRDGGFTILEILIVVVILLMAATLVAPAIDSGLRARQVRSAVRTIAGAMRSRQGEAVRTGKMQRMIIDSTANQIQLEHRAPLDLGEVAHIADLRGGELLSGGLVRVTFFPNGSNTGIALLVGERGMAPSEGFVVRLDPLIGLATIRDPRG